MAVLVRRRIVERGSSMSNAMMRMTEARTLHLAFVVVLTACSSAAPTSRGSALPSAAVAQVDGPAPPRSDGWPCRFPEEADRLGVDEAVVLFTVMVRADGIPESVEILRDPGAGFGEAARACVMSRRFRPALDASGNPARGSTPPIRLRFWREPSATGVPSP
jgi:periplasmic protein TonB